MAELISSPLPDMPALLERLKSEPDRPTLTFLRGRLVDGELTAHELVARIERFAAELREAGVVAGDRVALLSPNRLEVPIVLLALMRLGAAAVPLNPASAPEDWSYILMHAGVRGMVGTDDLLARVTDTVEFRRSIVGVGVDEVGEVALSTASLAEQLAVILYTSGTTGAPKGVALCQRNLLANAWTMARNFGLHGTSQLAVLPLFHAHAFGFGLMTALSTGGQLVFCEKLDPFSWAEQIRAQSVTVTSVVPTLLPVLLGAKVRGEQVPSLRHILVSSAPLPTELVRRWMGEVGIPLVQGWGLSEFTNFACCVDPASVAQRELYEALLYGQEVPSIGAALPGVEVQVVDGKGGVVAAGERGELVVRGPSRMLGYYNDPAQTSATLDGDGWLHSGDEGYWLPNGERSVFYISGRIKEIIIRDGEKYSPLALERKLVEALPELAGKIAIVGFTHQARGEEIGLYFEGQLDEPLAAQLKSAIERAPVAERVKVLLHGPAPIARTHTGKVQRKKMQPWFAAYSDVRGALKIVAV